MSYDIRVDLIPDFHERDIGRELVLGKAFVFMIHSVPEIAMRAK